MEHNEDLRERMCSETSDLISRSRLIDDLIIAEAVLKVNGDKAEANAVAMEIRKVESAPAIDLESLRPKGRKERSVISHTGLMCTNCYSDVDMDAVFCKYCGAKMEDEE